MQDKNKQAYFYYAAVALLALVVRIPFWPHVSDDWTFFFAPYIAAMEEGGVASLGHRHGNSSPAFTLLLFLISQLPVNKLYALKALFFAFECLTASFGRLLVRQAGLSEGRGLLVFWALLFSPSVVLNGSVWGQSDSVYSFFLVACLMVMLQERQLTRYLSNDSWVFLLFGIALSFKLQSTFFLLALIRYISIRQPKWTTLLWAGVPYAIFAAPLVLAGRDLNSVLTIYREQAYVWHDTLSFGCANLYKLLPGLPFEPTWKYGVALTAVACLLGAGYLHKWRPPRLPIRELRIAFLSCLLMVYLLPKMHERYYYPAELFIIILTAYQLSHWPLLLLVATASSLSYTPYLFQKEVLPVPVLAGMMSVAVCAAVVVVMRDTWRVRRR